MSRFGHVNISADRGRVLWMMVQPHNEVTIVGVGRQQTGQHGPRELSPYLARLKVGGYLSMDWFKGKITGNHRFSH